MNKEVEMVKYPDGSVNYFFPSGQVVSYQSIEEIKTVSLVPFPVPTKKKASNPMYNETFNQAAIAYNHLINRAYDTFTSKTGDLKKSFGLVDDKEPITAEEMVNRIIAGRYILRDEVKKKQTSRPADYVTWRDPAVKEDQVGFEVAFAQLDKQYQSVRDIVTIGTPAEGLKAINDFDAWTPTLGNA